MRRARSSDLVDIEDWLKEEFDRDGTGKGFWCNRRIIREQCDLGTVYVLFSLSADVPLAFCVCGSWHQCIDILVVHPDYRGQGHGKTLASHCLGLILQAGHGETRIECSPKSSIGFWKKLGFHEQRSLCDSHVTEANGPIIMVKTLGNDVATSA